jgi:hypothetical protein
VGDTLLARLRLQTASPNPTAPELSFTKTNLSRQRWTLMRQRYASRSLPDYGACLRNLTLTPEYLVALALSECCSRLA